MKRIITSFSLIVVLLLALFSLSSCDDGEITSVGLSFELNPDGKSYTVVGMGICMDKHVVIDTYQKKPITAIADQAFKSNKDITAITLGSTVREVGRYAFASCENLTQINLGEGLEKIHPNAFYGCEKLKKISLPDSLKVIDTYAFEYCTALEEIEFGKNLESIGDFGFYSCFSLKSIALGDQLKTIGESAFSNCVRLESASFGKSLVAINENAFAGCSALSNLDFAPAPLSIGESAFRMCSSLKHLKLPDGTYGIGRGAFSKCDALETVDFGNTIKIIGSEAFFACRNIKSLTLPDSLTNISGYAFQECTGLESISLPFVGMRPTSAYSAHLGNIFGSVDASLIPDSLKHVTVRTYSVPSASFRNCESLESVTVGPGAASIGSYAFDGCINLKSVVILDGVKNIGTNAFSGCEAITEVGIGSTVTSVGSYAFADCVNISRVETTSLASWCKISFGNATACPLYHSPDFYAEGKLIEELVVPEEASGIGTYAFCGSNIKSVTLHDKISYVNANSFDNCDNLKFSEYDNALYLGTEENPHLVLVRAKYTHLITVQVHPDTKIIGRSAFVDCIGLNSVVLPDSLVTIGNSAFKNCERLEEITIPKNVTTIGNQAFVGCYALKRVSFDAFAVWEISGFADGNVLLTAAVLSDPSAVSRLLTETYLSYTWHRRALAS